MLFSYILSFFLKINKASTSLWDELAFISRYHPNCHCIIASPKKISPSSLSWDEDCSRCHPICLWPTLNAISGAPVKFVICRFGAELVCFAAALHQPPAFWKDLHIASPSLRCVMWFVDDYSTPAFRVKCFCKDFLCIQIFKLFCNVGYRVLLKICLCDKIILTTVVQGGVAFILKEWRWCLWYILHSRILWFSVCLYWHCWRSCFRTVSKMHIEKLPQYFDR